MEPTAPQLPNIEDALEKIRDAGIRAQQVNGANAPLTQLPMVEIGHPNNLRGGTIYQVNLQHDVREQLQTETVAVIEDQPTKPTLLIANRIAPKILAKIRELGNAYLDMQGNVFIKQDDVIIWLGAGQKVAIGRRLATDTRPMRLEPLEEAARLYIPRAFEKAGVKVLLTLLRDPKLVNENLRDIAKRAGVGHGTVGYVMEDLRGKYVQEFGPEKGGKRLNHIPELLDEWAKAYARKLRRQTLVMRYQAPNRDWWREAELAKYNLCWGGEVAAAKLTQYLQPAIATLYGEARLDPRFLARHALREDANGNVEFRTKFWKQARDDEQTDVAPLPLIYADLLATDDPRCVDTAGRIREMYLEQFNRSGAQA